MDKVEIIKRNLAVILKEGDLYDVIAIKEGVNPQSHWFFKSNIFILSRILYVGVFAYDKIKSRLTSVEKVKRAQDEIRNAIGVNIDIVKIKKARLSNFLLFLANRFKKIKKSYSRLSLNDSYLSILYENQDSEKEDYIKALRRILNFCELSKIDIVFLKLTDVRDLFPDLELSEIEKWEMKTIFGYKIVDDLKCKLLVLHTSELFSLLEKMETSKVDKGIIQQLSSEIEDLTIKNALNQYFAHGNTERLKSILEHRLMLNINGESTYKDREFGKIYDDICIKDGYARIVSKNGKGLLVNNLITLLYTYFETRDFHDLINKINLPSDNKETLLIAALYLYLNEQVEMNTSCNVVDGSFYDRVFAAYKAKQKDKKIEIPGMKFSKLENIFHTFYSKWLTYSFLQIILLFVLLTGASMDGVMYFVSNNSPIFWEKLPEIVRAPYKYSLNLELDIARNLLWEVDIPFLDSTDRIKTSSVGDSDNKNNRTIGKIQLLKEEVLMPRYFAEGLAYDATYAKGDMVFDLAESIVEDSCFQDVEPLLRVVKPASRSEIKAIIRNEGSFSYSLYPLGDNYVLVSLQVIDANDDSKVYNYGSFSKDDAKLLKSMRNPEIHYTYGVSTTDINSFVAQIADFEWSYGDLSYEQAIEAITSGLDLEADASVWDIFNAIHSKTYSKTPIKNAGLTREIKKMSESEYLECLASLDSLICNMAATLAVQSSRDYIYTVGYLNDGNGTLSQSERHAWVMNAERIVDVTPGATLDEEENISFNEVINWGMQNNVPQYLLIALLSIILLRVYKKFLSPKIKIEIAKNILTSGNLADSYAMIKDALYGGVNVSFPRTPSEYVDIINNELNGFDVEELKELKKELINNKSYMDKEVLSEALKIIDKIPYIKENAEELKLALRKKDI